MKKIITLLLAAALMLSTALAFTGCSVNDTLENLEGTYTRDLAGTSLNVFNWGEYISEGYEGSLHVCKAFEKLTGIKVNYTCYASNEEMYGKMKSDAVAYDVIIPSDYMIQRLVAEDRLQKIDYSKLTNYHYIDEQYKGLFFDENNEYSVPYNVGLVGLIYNTKYVTEEPTSWKIMWDEKYKGQILTFDNPRDAFGLVQFAYGIDINSEDKADWDATAEHFKEQSKVLQGRVMDEVFNKMEAENAYIAAYYAGDYYVMLEENPDLAFVYPEEGTNIFVDSMCIPKNAQNYEAALMFINFMLEPEVALANAETICYASPNTAVMENDDYSFKDDEILYPEEKPKCEYFHDLNPEIRAYYEKLWNEVTLEND